jgi:hypothetical protein
MGAAGRASPWVVVVALILLAAMAGVVSDLTSASAPPHRRGLGATTTSEAPLTSAPPATTSLPSAPSELIEKVAFFNAENGDGLFDENGPSSCSWAVASTDDGGATFSRRVTVAPRPCDNTESIASFAFDDHGDGFILGSSLYVSHDDGMTWAAARTDGVVLSIVPLGPSVWMLESRCPSASDGTTCPLVLQQSTDGGRSWVNSVTLPVTTTFGDGPTGPGEGGWTWLVRTSVSSALILVPPPLGILPNQAPGRGTLLSTSSGGAQWQQQMAPCSIQGPSTALISQAPDGTIWSACAGEPGAGNQFKAFARSTNGGDSWISEAHCDLLSSGADCPPGASGGYLGNLAGLSSTTALIDGGRNTVWRTADGGMNWNEPSAAVGMDPNGTGSLFFANPLDGWVVTESYGAGGALWHTDNGGHSWSQVWP